MIGVRIARSAVSLQLSRTAGGLANWTSLGVRSESSLAALRKKTGFALNLCKKALQENQNDLSAAEKWLKEEAAKHGWAKASKLQSRPTAEGLIGVFVDQNSSSAVAVEVNCETDFVVRNEIFRNLVSDLTKTVASASIVNGSGNRIVGENDRLTTRYSLLQDQMEPFRESIVPAITQLGENIILKRALLMQSAPDSGVKITGYAHAVGGQVNEHNGIHVGKYGTLLAYAEPAEEDDPDYKFVPEVEQSERDAEAEQTEHVAEHEKTEAAGNANEEEVSGEVISEFEQESFEQTRLSTESMSQEHLSKLLCQHVIGMRPNKIRESIQDREEREKLRKIRKESGNKDDDEDESDALLDQKFLLDQQVTIRQLLKQKNMRVVDFVRFECGVEEAK